MSRVSQQRALDGSAGGPPPALPAPAMGWRYFPAEVFGDKAEWWQAASAGRGHIIRAVTTSSVSPLPWSLRPTKPTTLPREYNFAVSKRRRDAGDCEPAVVGDTEEQESSYHRLGNHKEEAGRERRHPA